LHTAAPGPSTVNGVKKLLLLLVLVGLGVFAAKKLKEA
jgi:hypothetical protein